MHRTQPPATSSRHADKEEALRRATTLALEERPAQVVVHSVRGDVSQCVIYDIDLAAPEDASGPDPEIPEDPFPDPEEEAQPLRA